MQNVLNALRVLEEVAASQPVGVSELARTLELPKSSVQRALRTLSVAGWIHPVGNELTRWGLTTKALDVGRHALGDLNVREAAMPIMEELRGRTQETIHLMVPEGDHVVLIERLETPKPVRIVLPLGGSSPLHGSANGKAVLASSQAILERLIGEGLPRYTDSTIVDPQRLLAEIGEVRDRGYATNAGEWRADIAAVATAILDATDRPIASLSISTPINRMPAESQPEYGALVMDAARRISAAIAGSASVH